jgi:hypothetical protein
VLKIGADDTLPLSSATARRMRLGLPVLALSEVMLQLPEVELPVATFVTATPALANVGDTTQEIIKAAKVGTRREVLDIKLRFTLQVLLSRPKHTHAHEKCDSSWLSLGEDRCCALPLHRYHGARRR